MTSRHKLPKVFLTILLILTQEISYAASTVSLPKERVSSRRHNIFAELHSLKNFGRVEESGVGANGKTVIYIQDAHDSLEVQENIAKMITVLVQNHTIKTVFEEGYEGPVPSDDFFGSIKPHALKEKVAYFFMDKLRLGGAEFAHINRKEDFRLIGADDRKLHKKNVRWYAKAVRHQVAVAHDLKLITTEMDALAARDFPKEVKVWLKLKNRLMNGEMDLADYLIRTARVDVGREKRYPNIRRYLTIQANPSEKRLEEAVKRFDAHKLFLEIDQWEDAFSLKHLEARTARKIFRFQRDLFLFRRLNDLKMTSAEYEAFRTRFSVQPTREMADFIAQEAGRALVLSKAWERKIQSAVQFYETARGRDLAVEKKLIEFLEKSTEKVCVLVFGGFHKDRIREVLKRNGFSWQIVSPRITKADILHQGYYKQLMSNGHHPFEVSFTQATAAKPEPIFVLPAAHIEIERITELMAQFPNEPTTLLNRRLEGVRSEVRNEKIASDLAAARDAAVSVYIQGDENALTVAEKEEQLALKDGKARIYVSSQTISGEGDRYLNEQFDFAGYENAILNYIRSEEIEAHLEELHLRGDTHPERHTGFFQHEYYLVVPKIDEPEVRQFLKLLAVGAGRYYGMYVFHEGDFERNGRNTIKKYVSIEIWRLDYNDSFYPYEQEDLPYGRTDEIIKELEVRGIKFRIDDYESGELNSAERHFSHYYSTKSIVVRQKDLPDIMKYLEPIAAAERRRQQDIPKNDYDQNFSALYFHAREINPAVNYSALHEAYLSVKSNFRPPVYSEDGAFRRFEIENTEHRIDAIIDMERFYQKVWGAKITKDSPFLIYLRDKLSIQGAYLEGKSDLVESAQHWATGYYTGYLHVPKQYEAITEFYLAAGSGVIQKVLFSGTEDIESEVNLGVRTLGETPNSSNLGNKEAGFLIFKKLGLPYPPGIALSEKLVQSILEKPLKDAEAYTPHIEEALKRAGATRMHLFSVRSNPKRSMPGILETVPATEFVLPAINSTGQAWFSDRAKAYRQRQGIPDTYDLPLIIQEWVEGVHYKITGGYYSVVDHDYPAKRREDPSLPFYGSGVFSTRNPNTGEDVLFGRYLENGRGDGLMTGGSEGQEIQGLAQSAPDILKQLLAAKMKLEEAVGPQEVEFTVENGKLYFLQTRKLNFSPLAEISYIRQQIEEKKITEARALPRIEKLQKQLGARKIYRVKEGVNAQTLADAKGATIGALRGQLVWNLDKARQLMSENKPIVFVATQRNAEEVLALIFDYPLAGLITNYGNSSSHEAVLTRLAGIPSLINLTASFNIFKDKQEIVMSDSQVLHEGDWVVVDADNYRLFLSDEDVLEENGTVQDASYGINIPDFKKVFLRTYQDDAGNLRSEFTLDRLETLNGEAEQQFLKLKDGVDKKAAFIANLEKHFIHEMLLQSQLDSHAPKTVRSEVRTGKVIATNTRAKGTLFLNTDELSEFSHEQVEELFAEVLMNRSEVRLVVYGKDDGRLGGNSDPAVRALLRLPYVFKGQGTAADVFERYKSARGDNLYLFQEGRGKNPQAELKAVASRQMEFYRLRKQLGQAARGQIAASFEFLKNGGRIRGVRKDQDGYWMALPEFCAELVRSRLADLVIAYAA